MVLSYSKLEPIYESFGFGVEAVGGGAGAGSQADGCEGASFEFTLGSGRSEQIAACFGSLFNAETGGWDTPGSGGARAGGAGSTGDGLCNDNCCDVVVAGPDRPGLQCCLDSGCVIQEYANPGLTTSASSSASSTKSCRKNYTFLLFALLLSLLLIAIFFHYLMQRVTDNKKKNIILIVGALLGGGLLLALILVYLFKILYICKIKDT